MEKSNLISYNIDTYANMKVNELRKIAKEKGVWVSARARKDDIKALLGVPTDPYANMKIEELRKIAKEKGVWVPARARKDDIKVLLSPEHHTGELKKRESGKQLKPNKDRFFGRKVEFMQEIWMVEFLRDKGAYGSVYDIRCSLRPGKFIVKIEKPESQMLVSKSHLLVEKEVYEATQNSKNIPKMVAYGEFEDGGKYIILPRFNYTLEQHRNLLTFKELSTLISDIMASITELHNSGYCHMDIKPENIMYSKKDNRWYLIDMGLCKKASNVPCELSYVCGTYNYMARTVHQGIYSNKSDIEAFLFTLVYASGIDLPWMNSVSSASKIHKLKKQFIKNRVENLKALESVKGVAKILRYFSDEE